MQTTFREGDLVAQKSGGPTMTVNRIVPDRNGGAPYVHCSWFSVDERKKDIFRASELKPAEADDEGDHHRLGF